jgi:Protein of unknown function (DUF3800)
VYIAYVDESGDHGLESIDPHYPIFVLACSVFRYEDYADTVARVTLFKFKYFGHDQVILHEREIRKRIGPFSILKDQETREAFHDDLTELVDEARFTLIASVIRKADLTHRYIWPENLYHLAMGFCLERLKLHLDDLGYSGETCVVFERRGTKEDRDLELEFRRICAGVNYFNEPLPFDIIIAPKSSNSSGLQMADMIARPVGRHVLDPTQSNRAYDVAEKKFRRSPSGKIEGWGLKHFPS